MDNLIDPNNPEAAPGVPVPAPAPAESSTPQEYPDRILSATPSGPQIRTQNDLQNAFYFFLKKSGNRDDALRRTARVAAHEAGMPYEKFDELFNQGGLKPEKVLETFGVRNLGEFETAAEFAAREAVATSPMIPAALSAGRVAANLAGAIPNPLARAAIVGGASVLGGLGGLVAGRQAEDVLFPLEPVSPKTSAARVAGETLGSGAAMLYPSVKAAQLIPQGLDFGSNKILSTVASLLSSIGTQARESPKKFLFAEGTALLPQMGAAYGSEIVNPGDLISRISSEFAASALFPQRIVATTASSLAGERSDIFSAIGKKMGEGGRQRSVGDYILESLIVQGADPNEILKQVKDPNFSNYIDPKTGERVFLTRAAATGDFAVTALENAVRKSSNRVDTQISRSLQESNEALSSFIVALRDTGDPKAIRAAAEARKDQIDGLLSNLIGSHVAQATKARERFLEAAFTGKPIAEGENVRGNFGEYVNGAVEKAMQEWRTIEKNAYARADLTANSSSDSIVREWSNLQNRLVRESPIPPIIRKFVSRASSDGVTLNEMKNFRGEMLGMARTARSQGDLRLSSIYGGMAEAALDDIGKSLDTLERFSQQMIAAGFPAKQVDASALRDAYQISRSGNDLFTRTFTSDILALDKAGAQRIPPEELAGKFFRGTSDTTALRIREVEEALALRFKDPKGAPLSVLSAQQAQAAEDRANTFNTAIDYLYRDLINGPDYSKLTDVVDPTTGAVTQVRTTDPARLQKFLERNAQLLDTPGMAGFKRDLSDLQRVNEMLKNGLGPAQKAAEAAAKDDWSSKVLGVENIATAIGDILGDKKNPESSFRKFLKMINDVPVSTVPGSPGPDTVRQSIRDNVMDWATQKAMTPDGTIDFTKLKAALFDPMSKNQPSVMGILSENGIEVVDDAFKKKLGMLMVRLANVQRVASTRTAAENLTLESDLAYQFLIRFAGANLGGSLPGQAPSLQTAAMGSQLIQRVLDRVPTQKAHLLLQEALQPTEYGQQLFVELLGGAIKRRPLTAAGQIPLAKDILTKAVSRVVGAPVLYAPFVGAAGREVVPPEYENRPLPGKPPAAAPAAQPAVPAAPAPRPAAPAAPPPVAPIQQRGSVTSPEERQRFAAMFPGDFVSPMIR